VVVVERSSSVSKRLAAAGVAAGVDGVDGEVDELGGEQQDDEAHDGAGQPQHQAVLELLEHVHQLRVRPARHVLGRLEAGAQQVDGGDDDQRHGRRRAGRVAATVPRCRDGRGTAARGRGGAGWTW